MKHKNNIQSRLSERTMLADYLCDALAENIEHSVNQLIVRRHERRCRCYRAWLLDLLASPVVCVMPDARLLSCNVTFL